MKKTTKKKLFKAIQKQDTCSSPVAPWNRAKTKQVAWQLGYQEGERNADADNKRRIELDKSTKYDERLSAITELIKQTAHFQEGVTKLVMAAEKQM